MFKETVFILIVLQALIFSALFSGCKKAVDDGQLFLTLNTDESVTGVEGLFWMACVSGISDSDNKPACIAGIGPRVFQEGELPEFYLIEPGKKYSHPDGIFEYDYHIAYMGECFNTYEEAGEYELTPFGEENELSLSESNIANLTMSGSLAQPIQLFTLTFSYSSTDFQETNDLSTEEESASDMETEGDRIVEEEDFQQLRERITTHYLALRQQWMNSL